MSQLMPEPLATWTWRLERVASGRTVLTRSQAVTARTDLVNDRAADPSSYAGYEEEFAAAVDQLEVLSREANRRDDLLAVLAAERRAESANGGGSATAAPDTAGRSRRSLAGEHDRVPAGLPQLLDEWVHRLIRYRAGAKVIAPIEAARAEIRLRNEAVLQPGAYRGVAAGYFGRTVRELGEIATAQRPGGSRTQPGLRRGIAGDVLL
jgi:hypothetical protein